MSSFQLAEAASGELRDKHYVKNENGVWVRATRLEAARTNSILHSEDFSDAAWSKNDVSVTADDATAPDGTTTADKLDDTSTSSDGYVDQSVSVSDDSLHRAGSVFVRKRTGAPALGFSLLFLGGTTASYFRARMDPETGDINVWNSGANGAVRIGVEDYNSDWWRVWGVVKNNGTGNTNLEIRIFPAQNTNGTITGAPDDSVTGHNHVWGAQLEGVSGGAAFPSSYIATAGSAVSRAADDLSWGVGISPQPFTLYVKFREGGNVDSDDARVIQWDGLNYRIQRNNGFYLYAVNGVSINFFDPSVPDAVGTVVELTMSQDTAGDLIARQSYNGGSVAEKTASGGSLPSSWDPTIDISQSNGGSGVADFISGPIIAPGVRTMDEMRNLAGTN